MERWAGPGNEARLCSFTNWLTGSISYTSNAFLSHTGSQVPCISSLQYFSVLTILEGFQWTVEKTYDEFAMLHKSVSISLTATTVCW